MSQVQHLFCGIPSGGLWVEFTEKKTLYNFKHTLHLTEGEEKNITGKQSSTCSNMTFNAVKPSDRDASTDSVA